jgi:hypothetical protein
VKSIPMPRDTPPPIPKEVLDKWYQKRREKMARERGTNGTNANNTPLGDNARTFTPSIAKPAPVMEAKTVYESKPIIRDLRKEAIAFVPAAVRTKLDKSKGVGGLVEPEEADKLEQAGYMSTRKEPQRGNSAEEDVSMEQGSRAVMMEEVEDEDG